MKKVLATILISAATMGFATASSAATTEAKAAYKAARENAATDYKVAREKCDSLSGNPKNVCVEEAKAGRIHVEADAKANYKNSLSARTNARKAIADADYDVNKVKCASQTGNEKDVCIKEAKAANIAAKADAKADREVATARIDARDEKRDANYKVAIEKCDALAGAAKDTCVASTKAQYGK